MSMNVNGPRTSAVSFLPGVTGSQQVSPTDQPAATRTASSQPRLIEWETATKAQKAPGASVEKTRQDYTDALIGRYQPDQHASSAQADKPFSLKDADKQQPFGATQVTSRLNMSDFPKPRPVV